MITAAAGTINRGKYTFVSKFALEIRLSEQLLSAAEKNCQGNIAANTKMA